jgi:hypothetical protein
MHSGGDTSIRTDLTSNQSGLHQQGVEGESLHYTSQNTSSQREPDWDDKRYAKVRERFFKTFSYISFERVPSEVEGRVEKRSPEPHATISAAREKGLWERATAAVKSFFIPPNNENPKEAQLTLLREINDIKDPRFLDVLMSIADYDVSLGKADVYDMKVIEEVDRAIASVIPHLKMDQLIRLKSQTESRLNNAQAYWKKNKANMGLEAAAARHIDRLKVMCKAIDNQLSPSPLVGEGRGEGDNDTHYISTHYKHALNGFVETPVKMGKGLAALIKDGNPVNRTPRFIVAACSAFIQGITDIPAEIGGLSTGGAYGLFGNDLGASVGNTALIALPFVKFAKGLRATKALGRGDFSRPNTSLPSCLPAGSVAGERVGVRGAGQPIEVVDLTKSPKIEVVDMTNEQSPLSPLSQRGVRGDFQKVDTPTGPVSIPGNTIFPEKPNSGSISAKGGLATYSETSAVLTNVYESPKVIADTPPSWSPPPEVIASASEAILRPDVIASASEAIPKPDVIASASEAIPKEPIGFPGIPGAAISDPKPRDADEMIVLPGADKTPETIGDPKVDSEIIGDIPPIEELHISALSAVENLEIAIGRMQKIRHPLTEEGKTFLEKARATLSNPNASNASTEDVQNILNLFPTVEEPHLEYFEDVMNEISIGDKAKIITQLYAIQIGKGCSHSCTHCAFSAQPKIQMMPYITALKIIEAIKRDWPAIIESHRETYTREFNERTEEIIADLRAGRVDSQKIAEYIVAHVEFGRDASFGDLQVQVYGKLFALLGFIFKGANFENLSDMVDMAVNRSEEAWELLNNVLTPREKSTAEKIQIIKKAIEDNMKPGSHHILLNGNDLSLPERWRLSNFLLKGFPDFLRLPQAGKMKIKFYRDSDPFDYRDTNMRDASGNKADYGDVAAFAHSVLKEFGFKIETLSVGWNRGDAVARRAAEKLANLGLVVVISAHFFSLQARNNPERHRASLKEVIRVLYPHIAFIPYGDYESMRIFIQGLYSELGLPKSPQFERDSGNISLKGRAREYFREGDSGYGFGDGYLIQPDGEIVIQNGRSGELSPTGYNIFSKPR